MRHLRMLGAETAEMTMLVICTIDRPPALRSAGSNGLGRQSHQGYSLSLSRVPTDQVSSSSGSFRSAHPTASEFFRGQSRNARTDHRVRQLAPRPDAPDRSDDIGATAL